MVNFVHLVDHLTNMEFYAESQAKAQVLVGKERKLHTQSLKKRKNHQGSRLLCCKHNISSYFHLHTSYEQLRPHIVIISIPQCMSGI